MNRWTEVCLGISPGGVLRGLRLGPIEFYRAARRAYWAAPPFEPKEQNRAENILRTIPEVSLEHILATSRVELKLPVMAYEDGMLPLPDLLALLSILALERPHEVLEIGTYMGHTTRAIAENAPNAVVYTIDLPEGADADPTAPSPLPKDDFHLIANRIVGREYKQHPHVSERIIQHFGDTALLDFAAMGRPSFFFIDGSHTYEYCKNDSEKCLALSSPGATFLWHDCDAGHPGVLQFVTEWRAAGRDVRRIAGTALGYWQRPESSS